MDGFYGHLSKQVGSRLNKILRKSLVVVRLFIEDIKHIMKHRINHLQLIS